MSTSCWTPPLAYRFVKIGRTVRLSRRIAEVRCQTLSRQTPIVVGLIEGNEPEEKALHKKYRSLRVRGEWFKFEGELAEYVNSLPHPLAWLLENSNLWEYADGWCGLPTHTSLEILDNIENGKVVF